MSADRTIDVDAVRADTPGCSAVVHLNNAGASLPPTVVTETVIAHLRREAAIGGYEAAAEATERTEAVYEQLAALLRCDPAEIALVESATRAWTAAFGSLRFAKGDRILTHRVEYASNFLPMLHAAGRDGVSVELVPSRASGEIDVDALDAMIDDRVRLIALTHVPSQNGLVNPAADVGRRARSAGIPFLLDACQSAGQLDLDVDALGCDVLAATGRKFLRAPRGTGFLFVRRDALAWLQPEHPDLRSADWSGQRTYRLRDDARRFEQFERSVANVLGLGAAAAYARAIGLDAIEARVTGLGARLRAALDRVRHVTVRDEGTRQCAIVTFTVDGVEPEAIVDRLHDHGVNMWPIDAATARLDLDARGLRGVVRASVHYYNTEAEIDRAAELVEDLVAELPR